MESRQKILRWGKLARVTHWLLFIGVTLGFLTGLPVLDGRLFMFLYNLFGGEAGREFIHYYFVTAVLVSAIPFVIIRAVSARAEEWWWPSWAEIRQAVKIALRWVGITKNYPKIGFHHPLEKIYLMISHLGLILLGVSGIPMVFFDITPSMKAVLLLIHDLGFFMVAVPLVGHFMLSINPVNKEALRAMFYDGRVTIEWAEKHHPLWIEHKERKS
ncbi:MAG: cytochrome b/b6 domain-containing protein [Nitrososphaeria archaeon]|nr:cytochrome b/b6 domain-containing protein [Nitrososphaeria archaeon]